MVQHTQGVFYFYVFPFFLVCVCVVVVVGGGGYSLSLCETEARELPSKYNQEKRIQKKRKGKGIRSV
jgi:hypothetical protein